MRRFVNILILLILLAVPLHSQAALTGWSTANYLRRLTQVHDNVEPLYISIWVNRAGANATGRIVVIGQDGGENHSHSVKTSGTTNTLEVTSRDTGASSATSAITISADTWHHIGSYLVSDTNRIIRQDNANEGSNGSSRAVGTADSIYIGIRPDAAVPWGNTAALAESSIWNGGMTEANMDDLNAKLAAGENPINVNAEVGQPWSGALVAYWIDSANTITDLAGNGHDLTMVGTLTNFASHPTIDPVTSAAVPSQVIIVNYIWHDPLWSLFQWIRQQVGGRN